jgi:hypothetical protein
MFERVHTQSLLEDNLSTTLFLPLFFFLFNKVVQVISSLLAILNYIITALF